MAELGSTRGWIGRGILFLAIFAPLQIAWQALRETQLGWLIVHNGTVRPAVQLVNWLTPSVHARAVGFSLAAPGGGLNILNGCEGMEALFMLAAAFAVAPIPRGARAAGFLLGIPLVFVANQARILSLFYAFRSDAALFDTLHGAVTPIAIIAVITCYFYAWTVPWSRPRSIDASMANAG